MYTYTNCECVIWKAFLFYPIDNSKYFRSHKRVSYKTQLQVKIPYFDNLKKKYIKYENKNTIPNESRHVKRKRICLGITKIIIFYCSNMRVYHKTKRMMRQLIFPFSILLAMKRYIINVLYYTAVSALYFVKEWLILLKKNSHIHLNKRTLRQRY